MDKKVATKTLNPLHFEDLEPHRFEDLVRQLLYDFKNWKSLEATGRLGADEGVDIRGVEISPLPFEPEDEVEEEASIKDNIPIERLWVIQCKRERSIGPKKIESIVSSSLASFEKPPFGFMIVAACDFSKASRDVFRRQIIERGVQEFFIWGRAEIEDLLFMPKNDHLLFAYFGISIQIRRRSMKSTVRSRIALKKKLIKEFGDFHHISYKPILIRDPKDTKYPFIESPKEFIKAPRWRYWQLEGHEPPDHLAFIVAKYFAYADPQSKKWDAILDYDASIPNHPTLCDLDRSAFDPEEKQSIYRIYWERNVPEANRAWATTVRFIHYDRILVLDEHGDSYNEGPHLLVDYINDVEPFEPNWEYNIVKSANRYFSFAIRPQKKLRKSFFPKKIPDEREIYHKELEEKYKKDKS